MFECHVTCLIKDAAIASEVAKELHWKTSEIARDPVLGNDTFFYLTTHADDLEVMFSRLQRVGDALWIRHVEVVRQKIEVVIYDTKRIS